MRIIYIIFLFAVTDRLYSQDTLGNEKNNFLAFNCDYLYNQYFGHRTAEFFPGASSSIYSNQTAENTSGLVISTGYRHFFNSHFFIQPGIGLRFRISSYIHNDSIVNVNNSSLKRVRVNYYTLETPLYFGIKARRLSFLSGFIIPLVTYSFSTAHFSDGSKTMDGRQLTKFGELYLSEKLQYNILKKQNINISVGADVSPDIFRKNSGYKINWNAGIMWLLERHKKARPEDYVQ
jgi:hypothetical protein